MKRLTAKDLIIGGKYVPHSKSWYEDETLDYSFSRREITGQLELINTSRENDFPNLDEVTKAEYLDLVAQLDELDQEQADYYRKQLT